MSLRPPYQPWQKIAYTSEAYTALRPDAALPAVAVGTAPDVLPSDWVATEKIHGAQLQLYCRLLPAPPAAEDDASDESPPTLLPALGGGVLAVWPAKRSGWMSADEPFFGHVAAIVDAASALSRLADTLLRPAGSAAFLVLYGELFGGWYPSAAEAPKWKGAAAAGRTHSVGGASAVQEGVYYSSSRHFAVFDAAVGQLSGACGFVDFDVWSAAAAAAGVFTPPLLARGTYEAVAGVSEVFQSKVPAALTRLDGVVRAPLPSGTNFAEGVVLRPVGGRCNVALPKGGGAGRPFVKRKHGNFAEVEAELEGARGADPASLVQHVMLRCVNAPRIAAAVSKHGAPVGVPSAAYVTAVEDAVAADVADDFWSVASPAAQAAYAALKPEEMDAIDTDVRKAARSLLLT